MIESKELPGVQLHWPKPGAEVPEGTGTLRVSGVVRAGPEWFDEGGLPGWDPKEGKGAGGELVPLASDPMVVEGLGAGAHELHWEAVGIPGAAGVVAFSVVPPILDRVKRRLNEQDQRRWDMIFNLMGPFGTELTCADSRTMCRCLRDTWQRC